MTKPKAVYAGSFDPFTNGHLDVVRRASKVFDVIVAVGNNPAKKTMFTLEERKKLVEESLAEQQLTASVVSFEGLLVKFCKENDIPVMLRGLRSATDFDYELNLAQVNKSINYSGTDTFFLPTNPATSYISSSMVRELARHGADIEQYTSMAVSAALVNRCKEIAKLERIKAFLGKIG